MTDFSSLIPPFTSLLPTGAGPAVLCPGLLAPMRPLCWPEQVGRPPLPSFILAPPGTRGGAGWKAGALPVHAKWGPS